MTNIVLITFKGNTSYIHYEFKNDIVGLEEGDKVVVDTVHGLTVGTVQGFKDPAKSKATKWVVQKIDTTAHEARLEKERKLSDIKAKLEERRKKLEKFEVYQLLAKSDPTMEALLNEFKALTEMDN